MIKCKICESEFDTIDSLRRHNSQKHNINAEQTYIDYVLGGVEPTCKCGCGEKPKYLGIDSGYRDYIIGHAARINNNWGHNPEAIKKSHETQKKMYESGELTIWNKGLNMDDERVKDNIEKIMSNPNRGKNISKKLKGIAKSENHKEKIKIAANVRWSDENEREKQSHRLISNLIKNNYRNKKTKLEIKFQSILESLGFIEKIESAYQKSIRSPIFDFYFDHKNLLIEVHGDFHHCNPNSIHSIPKYSIQLKTISNDIRKNRIADNKKIKLLRFWESDINNNLDSVVEILKKELF